MIRRLRKGNALAFVTIVMFAISLLAASLTLYFAIGNRQVEVSNRYFNYRIELSTEANREYLSLLNGDNAKLANKISLLDKEMPVLEFRSANEYQVDVSLVHYTSYTEKEFMFSVYKTTDTKQYKYSVLMEQNGSVYDMTNKEAYYVFDI